MNNRFYWVTYTRLLAGGQRRQYNNVMMQESDLKLCIMDDTPHKYILISAQLMSEEEHIAERKRVYGI